MRARTAFALCIAHFLTAAPAGVSFSDARSGVSFRYPTGFVLKQGPLDGAGDPSMGYLGPVPTEFASTGGLHVATVSMPSGSFAGTDFTTAFFTVRVHPRLTEDECAQFAGSNASSLPVEEARTISGIRFQSASLSDGGLGHQFFGIYRHGYSGTTCYELGYGLATAGYGAVDGMKHVNSDEIFAVLEKILTTVAIRPPARGK